MPRMAKQKYQQLQPIERMRIEIWKSENVSAQEMGRRLGRSASTITREVKRNTCQANGYQAQGAQWQRSCRRTGAKPNPKLHPDGVLWAVVCELLRWKWSPQEIAATLKQAYAHQSQHYVSHETIYTAIYAYPKGELRKELIACLRQNRTKRMPRSRGQDRRGKIPEMVSIHVRPPEVDDRIMPGHWEATSLRAQVTSLLWPCWLNVSAVQLYWPKCQMPVRHPPCKPLRTNFSPCKSHCIGQRKTLTQHSQGSIYLQQLIPKK